MLPIHNYLWIIERLCAKQSARVHPSAVGINLAIGEFDVSSKWGSKYVGSLYVPLNTNILTPSKLTQSRYLTFNTYAFGNISFSRRIHLEGFGLYWGGVYVSGGVVY